MRLFYFVSGITLGLVACVQPPPPPDRGLEQSHVFKNYQNTERHVTGDAQFDDTLRVVAYAVGHAPDGRGAIMRLARPDYSEGNPGFSGYNPGGKVPIAAPTDKAEVKLKKSDDRFIVTAPLYFHNVPYGAVQPYLFHAKSAGRFVDLKDERVQVLDLVPVVAAVDKSGDSTNAYLGKVPRHLADVGAPVAFVVPAQFKLAKYEARVPSRLDTDVDWEETERFYDRMVENSQKTHNQQLSAEYARIGSWSKSERLIEEAIKYVNGNANTSFVAHDRKGLVQERRDRHAIEILNAAVDADERSERPYRLLYDAHRAVGEFDGAERVVREAASRNALPTGMDDTLSKAVHDSTFYASKEFATRTLRPPKTTGRPFRAGFGTGYGSSDMGSWYFSLILSITPTPAWSIDGTWIPAIHTDEFAPDATPFKDAGAYSIDLRYLTPTRVQLGRAGFRLHGMLGAYHYMREEEMINTSSPSEAYSFDVSGWTGRVGVGLTGNSDFGAHNPHVVRFEVGYQYGQKQDVVVGGAKTALNPSGWFVNLAFLL